MGGRAHADLLKNQGSGFGSGDEEVGLPASAAGGSGMAHQSAPLQALCPALGALSGAAPEAQSTVLAGVACWQSL